ncbi:MAG: Gfo/Idh/MocA family oxidoreductase [Chloroflexota bacterium]|nr:Gfo/Idh/MocA family oxidoreductase [Chloroflexota bacterium]
MTTSPIRVGIIGLDHWYWAFSFAQATVSSSQAEIVAIADSDFGRAQEAAKRFGVERVTADPRELIEDQDIDVIASFVSIDQNPSICIAAAERGKHLFSVKPMARTLDEATRILDAVRRAGVIFLPAESTSRDAAQPQQIKRWIAEGKLGRIITATYSQHAGLPQRWPGESDSGWFIDPERAPGGGWIDHAIYHIDMLRWLLDDAVQSVSGRTEQLKYPELGMEDYGTATIQFKSGVIATIEVTWVAPPQGGRTSWTIIGTEGAVAFDSMAGRFSVVGDFPPFNGWVQTNPRGTFSEGLDALVSAIQGETTPIATAEDAWHNLAVCLAFYDAASAGAARSPAALPSA